MVIYLFWFEKFNCFHLLSYNYLRQRNSNIILNTIDCQNYHHHYLSHFHYTMSFNNCFPQKNYKIHYLSLIKKLYMNFTLYYFILTKIDFIIIINFILIIIINYFLIIFFNFILLIIIIDIGVIANKQFGPLIIINFQFVVINYQNYYYYLSEFIINFLQIIFIFVIIRWFISLKRFQANSIQ